MICSKFMYGDEPCKECRRRWLIVAELATVSAEDVYFCFDSEDEARKVYAHLERSCCYLGYTIRKKSAILFKPKEQKTAYGEYNNGG